MTRFEKVTFLKLKGWTITFYSRRVPHWQSPTWPPSEIRNLSTTEAYTAQRSLDGGRVIIPRADDPESGYDADCSACLRGRIHTIQEHEAKLEQSYEFDSGGDDRAKQGLGLPNASEVEW